MNSDFTFDPHAREIDSDPFPLYKRLRDDFPCYWSEAGQCWVLSRFDDIVAAGRDWQHFSSAKGNMLDDLKGRTGVTLGTTDPPRHDQMRALVQSAFSKRNNQPLIESTRTRANQLIDQFYDSGKFDFIAQYSSPLTIAILSSLLGIPAEDSDMVRKRVILILQTDPETRKKSPESIKAFEWLQDYTDSQLKDRIKNPGNDLFTLIQEVEIDGDRLRPQEMLMTSLTLIMAGLESGSSFMTMFAMNLHDHPDARQALVDDPELIPKAMEESLRFNTSAQRFRRTMTEDFDLHGQTLRAGDKVLLCYGSGNRDGRQFDNPDTYDISRKIKMHLGFGHGKHLCIGIPVARILIVTAMETLLARIPDFHQSKSDLDWLPSTTFRSPMAYGLEF